MITDRRLKPSSDRKVRSHSRQKNTYGLLPGLAGTCPGATTGEGGCWQCDKNTGRHTCYVDKIMRIYSSVEDILRHNTEVLLDAKSVDDMAELLAEEFFRFEKDEIAYKARKQSSHQSCYRIHWAGDFFNEKYAKALALAVRDFPSIQFWVYTRSLDCVKHLVGIKNLTVSISMDEVNIQKALQCYHKQKGKAFVAYMAETLSDLLPVKLRACPVDDNKLALEQACTSCRMCINGQHVFFKTKQPVRCSNDAA